MPDLITAPMATVRTLGWAEYERRRAQVWVQLILRESTAKTERVWTMTTKVFTRYVCDRCNTIKEVRGAEESYPPPDWAEGRITRRNHGPGWTNRTVIWAGILCDLCAYDVGQFLRQPLQQGVTK